MLDGCPASIKIVILDCCHSGAFGSSPLSTNQFATSFRAVPGCVTLTASRSDQQSLETDELNGGVFTHSLVKGLRGAANRNTDNIVDVLELFIYTSGRVKKMTQGRQSPSISMDQSDEIPKVMPLKSPDSPSDLVGVIAFPLPPSPQTMTTVIDTISRFPAANPSRTIGICHWVQKYSTAGSETYQQATALISRIDAGILAGKYRLAGKEAEEQAWDLQRTD